MYEEKISYLRKDIIEKTEKAMNILKKITENNSRLYDIVLRPEGDKEDDRN